MWPLWARWHCGGSLAAWGRRGVLAASFAIAQLAMRGAAAAVVAAMPTLPTRIVQVCAPRRCWRLVGER